MQFFAQPKVQRKNSVLERENQLVRKRWSNAARWRVDGAAEATEKERFDKSYQSAETRVPALAKPCSLLLSVVMFRRI